MKVRNLASTLLLIATAVFASSAGAQESPEQGQGIGFECVSNNGIPTTIVVGPNGEVPMISWTSNHFSNDGWTPEARCRDVTSRLARAHQSGTLEFLTTGRINNLPVICSTSIQGGGCESLIYTLKPNQNPATTLQSLIMVRTGQRGPISETSSRPYIPVSQFTGGSRFGTEKMVRPTKSYGGGGNLF